MKIPTLGCKHFSELLVLAISLILLSSLSASNKTAKPNIIWIMAEDISTELSCYGHPAVNTPHLDAMAKKGARYTQAFCTGPSCTPSRNAMMTGVYQTRTDTQDQRRRGVVLPGGIKPITDYLRNAGYYTALGCGFSGKTDLNFSAKPLFDGNDWSKRKPNQPFFAQITLDITHRYARNQVPERRKRNNPVDPAKVELPPYFPDHPVCREDWATYLDTIQIMDKQVGEIMARLEKEGIADSTVVIFIGDNGRCHLRGKCWLYDAGLKVPLIIRWPEKIKPNTVNDDLVSMIDISATILDIAGIKVPDTMDGHSILGPRAQKREHIFAARDLVDEVMDHIRCVRNKRYKYIRNYTPENGYRECRYVQRNRPMLATIRKLGAEGKLTSAQQLILKTEKPKEELYDLKNDPHEIHNLATSSQHKGTLQKMSHLLDEWIKDTGDTGLDQFKAAATSAPGIADKRSYLSGIVTELQKKWPTNRTINIVCHGHSVPSGYFRSPTVNTFNAYPHVLHWELKKRYPNAVINVIVTGIGGETADKGAARFEKQVLTHRPDVLTIDYSLNDRGIGLAKAKVAWEKMIKQAKAKGVKVILLTPTADLRAKTFNASDPLSQHAAQVRELAKKHNVGLADSYAGFNAYVSRGGKMNDLMSTGNHPNRKGHNIVTNLLLEWFPKK